MLKSFTALVAFLCLGPPSLPPAPPAPPKPVPQMAFLRIAPETLANVPVGQAMMIESALSASDVPASDSRPAVKTGPRFKARLAVLVKKYAKKHGVDEKLVQAVLRQESGGDPGAVSPKGAQGLMQLMPETAASLGVKDAFDPEENVAGGVKYLKHCLSRFKQDVVLALAAYNAGPKAVEKYHGVPPYQETEKYVASITKAYQGKAWNREDKEAAEPRPVKKKAELDRKIPTLTWKIADPQVRVPGPRWKEKSPGRARTRSLFKEYSTSAQKLESLRAERYGTSPSGAYPTTRW